MSLIPSLKEDKQGRMSKALILQKGNHGKIICVQNFEIQ